MRWVYFFICGVLGLALLACGLLVPAHLRAVDAAVVATAGRNGPSLLEQAQTLAGHQKLGAAQMLVQAARTAGIPGWDAAADAINDQARRNPAALVWGNSSRTEKIFGDRSQSPGQDQPFTSFMVREASRDAALAELSTSAVPAVAELLKTRSLKSTVLFPPSQSASGQAFDTAVCICGLLIGENHLQAQLGSQINDAALQANRSASSLPLEQSLMDLMSLGQRFNWDQLTAFVADIPDTKTLLELAKDVRSAGDNLPVLFAAVQLSGKPADVAGYLASFPDTGMKDLSVGLRHGAGGVGELVKSGKRYYRPDWAWGAAANPTVGAFVDYAANVAVQNPPLALAARWLLIFFAGFLLAQAFYFARPLARATPLDGFFLETALRTGTVPRERPSRGFHFIRVFLFSLAFLFVVLLLSEPFLVQEIQKGNGNFSLRLAPSTMGGAVFPGIAGFKQTIMNPTILLTLCVFFVLQALIYISCLVKLSEIQRQKVPPRMKLRLLENEDHLFDAGLYLGFVGTIISLIIASMGLVKFSLMAAYSSTSFGIIFVVVFKIFHLRPARRKLLLEAEMQDAGYPPVAAPATPTARATPAAPPAPATPVIA